MIRVLVVDDQSLVRSGFHIILDSEPDIEVVAEAANGEEAVRLAAELAPAVICMDVEMPIMDGIEASRRILAAANADDRPPAILILTTFGHESYLFDALAAGVSGFLLKTSRSEQLIDAVRTLANGQALLGPDVTKAVLERVAAESPSTGVGASAPGSEYRAERGGEHGDENPSGTGSVVDSTRTEAMDRAGLTEREREVLGLLAKGRSNAEIASTLFLGESTVKTHVSNILQKLGVRDRIQAVVWAHTNGVG